MNPILLILIFVISSISCLHHYAPDATESAQSLIDTIRKAYDTKDKALFLSVFDESFNAKVCSFGLITYKDLEKTDIEKNQNGVQLEIKDARITEYGLMFYVIEQPPKDNEKVLVFAKSVDGKFKINGIDFIGLKCPEPETLLDDTFE